MDWTERATLVGSNRYTGEGLPVSIWQKSQRRVHSEPPIRKVASLSSQHSKMLGQPASSQTVCRPSFLTRFFSPTNSGPIWTLALIHSGLRSTGTAALRCSIRSIFRPSGARVMIVFPLSSGGVGVCRVSAFDDVDGEAAHGGFLVFVAHVLAGFAHGDDDFVEGDAVGAVAPERHFRGVDRFRGGDRVPFDAGDLDQPADRVTRQAQVVFHRDFRGVLHLGGG